MVSSPYDLMCISSTAGKCREIAGVSVSITNLSFKGDISTDAYSVKMGGYAVGACSLPATSILCQGSEWQELYLRTSWCFYGVCDNLYIWDGGMIVNDEFKTMCKESTQSHFDALPQFVWRHSRAATGQFRGIRCRHCNCKPWPSVAIAYRRTPQNSDE